MGLAARDALGDINMQTTETTSVPLVRHRERTPVLMIGHGSSGTSILALLLRNYLQISFGTESQFVVHYYNRQHRYGDLREDANLRRLVRDISRERWFRRCEKFGYHVDPEGIVQDVRVRSYRGVLDAVFGQFARSSGMVRWGDKAPEYAHHLPVLGQLFPDARYIHMVRDGRDVANSVMGRYWGAKNVFVAAQEWRKGVELIDAFTASLPQDRLIVVRYEDLLAQPVDVFARLISFLQIDDSNGNVRRHVEQHAGEDLKTSNFDKWRRWPQKDRLRFERIAGDLLRKHGYETLICDVEDRFGMAEHCYWHLHNKFWKWTYPRYWQDNAYRARLRLVDAWRTLRSKICGRSV